jgi:ABC-type sugar transport system ATPase subunit
MASILLDAVTVEHDEGPAVSNLTLRVEDGEFLVLLGPSGSGKTSALRVIAGLDAPTRGDVLIDGTSVEHVPPAQRNVAMVFQDNVLYTFMNVRRNVGFPLSVQHLPQEEITARVEAESRVLAIQHLLDRMPRQLSAGYQQLVQAAKAMVRVPEVFLMDEPIARLDAALRRSMRAELKLLQQGYQVTTVYATNDQEDAMALAARIAILDRGTVRQVGTPADIYRRPADRFVAGFVGSPSMGFLLGRVRGPVVEVGGFRVGIPTGAAADGSPVTIGVRSEDWEVTEGEGIRGTIDGIEHLGSHQVVHVSVGGASLPVRRKDTSAAAGDAIVLRPVRYHVFDTGGRAVYHSEL